MLAAILQMPIGRWEPALRRTTANVPSGRPASYQQTILALQSAGPVFLVLDGLEKVQDDGARGGIFGDLTDRRLTDLLVHIADGYHRQVRILITSRFPLAILEERGSLYYRPLPVEQIDEPTAIALLKQRGVRGTDDQLRAIAEDCGRHALTVDLAGGYIAEFGGGDPATPLDLTHFDDEDQARRSEPTNARRRGVRLQEYRFARVAERYRAAFKEHDPAALALLERICLFRLGVTADVLASIFTGAGDEKHRIAGPALASLTRSGLDQTLDRLVAMKLVESSRPDQAERRSGSRNSAANALPERRSAWSGLPIAFSIHPAVRDGFLDGLDADTRRHGHEAARTGLTTALEGLPGRRSNPSDPATLDLLEEIVHHTLQSGHVPEAWDIYWSRIGGYQNLGHRLGAYERGERICRAFADGASPEALLRSETRQEFRQSPNDQADAESLGDFRYTMLPEATQATFINEWALYLKNLGRLAAAARCYELVVEMPFCKKSDEQSSICNRNLSDAGLLFGRLTSCQATAAEALRLAELADDATQRYRSHAYRAHAHALRGKVPAALAGFRAALDWQHQADGENDPLWSLPGMRHTHLLARLGRRDEATRLTEANIAICDREFGAGDADPDIPKCNLILSALHLESGDLAKAESLRASAHDWAVARDAKEVLCWSALVQARIELARLALDDHAPTQTISRHTTPRRAPGVRQGFIPATEASEPPGSRLGLAGRDAAHQAVESGLQIARDCGFGIYHIDLLLTRARLHLLSGDPASALADVRTALGDESDGIAIPADEHAGQVELLAATHPDCGYAWALPEALQLRAEALLLQAAQSLGTHRVAGVEERGTSDEPPADSGNNATGGSLHSTPATPDAETSTLINDVRQLLHKALDHWRPLRDTARKNANFRHPETRRQSNHRAAETWQLLTDLKAGLLTKYPLSRIEIGISETHSEPQSSSGELTITATTYKYDALISYRRQEPDKTFARDLLGRLEAAGLTVAIDERDFDPVATFLEEMERCIKESRFTLAVMSPRYLESGNCEEESIICKVLDMAERRRRIIPVTIEDVTMPTWLYNVVGINFTDPNPLVDPHDKLVVKLQTR